MWCCLRAAVQLQWSIWSTQLDARSYQRTCEHDGLVTHRKYMMSSSTGFFRGGEFGWRSGGNGEYKDGEAAAEPHSRELTTRLARLIRD